MPTKSEVLAAWHACRAANEAFFATFFAAYPRGSIIQWVDRVDGCRVKGRLLGPAIAYTCPGVVYSGPVKVEEECVAIEHWESGTLMSIETVVEHNEPQNMTTTIYTDTQAEKIGREWAGKRGKVPASHNRGGLKWYWLMDTDVGDGFSDPGVLPDPVYDLIAPNMRDYPTESAAFAALGRAVVRGREVFE